jgi:hypothetical protein
MLEFPLHECSLHVDRANAQAMVRGFVKDGHTHYQSILTDKRSGNYLRLWRHSSGLPRLLTPFREHTKYELSRIGIPLESYQHFDLKYVCFLDTVICLRKTNNNDVREFEIWNDLCSSGIFDIWNPRAPILNLRGSDLPMILILRVCEVHPEFDPVELTGRRFLKFVYSKPRNVRILRPIIENREFAELREAVTRKAQPLMDRSTGRPVVLWHDTCQLLAKIS